MLKGPWRDLDPSWRHAWLHGTGDRVIVHRWRNRGKHWSHAEKWAGVATELLAKYQQVGRRARPRASSNRTCGA